MEKITRDQLIAKLSQMDGTSEIVDALLDWFETPQRESDWSTVNGVPGYIERVVTGDMPKTILSDWATYGDWCRHRMESREWVIAMVYAAIDLRWCIQASAKSWPKDIRRADERYDSVAENPMQTWVGRMYELVYAPELRKRSLSASASVAEKNAIADRLRKYRDYGEDIVECMLGYHVNLREWVSGVGIGMVPKQLYDRVKQVFDTIANAKVQRDEFRENEWVHDDKCQRMRDRYAKEKMRKEYVG